VGGDGRRRRCGHCDRRRRRAAPVVGIVGVDVVGGVVFCVVECTRGGRMTWAGVDWAQIVVVLVRPEGPQNTGSVARLCGNFGTTLRLVAPLCDTTCRDALKMAHPREQALLDAARFDDLDAALADVALSIGTSGKISDALAAPPWSTTAARLVWPAPGEKTALVFGNERTGLAKTEAERCTRLVRLPTPGPVDSFNLSSAVAVMLTLLHGAIAGDGDDDDDDAPVVEHRASEPARAALRDAWSEALGSAGFYRTTTREQFAPRLVELLDKMDISERDATLLKDMFTRLRR
jgi:tRNA/rRNA methyltransferase